MKFKKSLCALLLCGGLVMGSIGLTACTSHTTSTATVTSPNGGDKPNPTPTPDPTPTPTPDPEPVYEWKSIDLFQPTMIVGGRSSVVYDENGKKQKYTDLVDRQLDMLAQEIISRLEYVYGDSNKNETHNIKDNLNNTTFTTYNSMNVFSESLSKSTRYPVYDSKGNGAGNGYIMMTNGEKVVYDSALHSHYITLNGTKYAAVCTDNVAGIFTSETALQSTFEGLGKPTISHVQNSYDHEGILTFQNAIYGSPTWEYEEITYGTQTQYSYTYNKEVKTKSWNWSEEFRNGTAKDKLKTYLTYLVANNVTNYNSIKNIDINANNTPTNAINDIYNYIINYRDVIFELITKEIVGEQCYKNDLESGLTGELIARTLYKAYEEFDYGEKTQYYEDGRYMQLYASEITSGTIKYLNKKLNSNLSAQQFLIIRNYKAYDVVINGILRQISHQTTYKTCNAILYETKTSINTVSTDLSETHAYLFIKAKTTNDVRVALGVPYATSVTLTDQSGRAVTYTKENVNGKLVLKVKGNNLPNISSTPSDTSIKTSQGYGATSTISDTLSNSHYLHLTLKDIDSFKIETTHYVKIN